MNISTTNIRYLVPAIFLILLLTGPDLFSAPAFQYKVAEDIEIQQSARDTTVNSNHVEIISTGMNFDAPKEIPSGWSTFSYNNNSSDTHFFVLEKMPEGKNIADLKSEVVPIFGSAMKLITEGQPDQGFAEFDKLPTWFYDVEFTGGAGLISPGGIAETSIDLEPGNYVIECYVKMPDGQFHSALGMMEEITVTEDRTENIEPFPTVELTISNIEGITGIAFDELIDPGEHIFAVHFKDQSAHENFVGHDVHLVRLEENADLTQLADWVDWTDPAAFKTPSPEGFEFLGGTQEMPEGKTSYFNANLTPGFYALVSEVTNPVSKNMLITFKVSKKKIAKY